MKENSIEEDIKLVEELINAAKEYNQFEGNKYHKAIEHILKDYKRILKENEELLEVKVSTSAHNRILELEKENEELKNNTRKNENELEFDIDCDWIALQKMLDESEKSNEYISYKNEKWIKEKYCIPVQKIKDKIEELNKAYEDSKDENGESEYYYPDYTIRVLEELLESE